MNGSLSLTTSQDTTASVLARASRGRELSVFETHLIEVLHDDIFRRADGLNMTELCALSYRRFRYLHSRVDLTISNVFSNIDHLLMLHEWVSLVDGTLTTLLTIHFNLCIGSVMQLGEGRAELQPLLDELDRLDTIGVFLATELGFGNNLQSLETQAVYDHATSEFVIHTPSAHAQKFMPNTGAHGIPKLAVVMARLMNRGRDCGVFPFIVRIRTAEGLCAGVQVTPLGDKPDYSLDNAITSFESVRIPKSYWLSGGNSHIDDDGVFFSQIRAKARRFFASIDRVQMGKLCLSFSALGFMRASLQLTLRYSQQRKTFGPGRSSIPILHYKTYQQEVFEAVATSYACSFLMQHVAACYRNRTTDDLASNRLLAVGKTFVSTRAQRITAMCRERIGAQGLFSANRIISYWIHTNGIVTAEGDNEVLLVRIARELLQELDYAPPPALRPEPELFAIECAESLIALVRERERKLHQGLVIGIRAARRGSFFEAWNENLPSAIELASVYSVRVALEAFKVASDSVEDLRARDLLDRLLRLFALRELTAMSTALLVDGTLKPEAVAQFAAARMRLAAGLFLEADTLVDVYQIPDALLDAPIAVDYIAAYDFMNPRTVTHSGFIQVRPSTRDDASRLRGA